MRYIIKHEASKRLRIHITDMGNVIDDLYQEGLEYVLKRLPGVTKVSVFRNRADLAVTFRNHEFKEEFKAVLNGLDPEEIEKKGKERIEQMEVSYDEVKKRKLTPELKRKMRAKIALEAIADAFLPKPVQLAYHAYQFISLKEF